MNKKLYILLIILLITFLSANGVTVGYSFVSLGANYSTIISQAKTNEYEVKEIETDSVFGAKKIELKKSYKVYKEYINVFFDQNDKLINFTVRFILKSTKTRKPLENLFIKIKENFIEKYGESERQTVPYYKNYENRYIVFLKPIFPGATGFDIYFEDIDNYTLYKEYYYDKLETDEKEEIDSIINSL